MAARNSNVEHKAMLTKMADTWDSLAREREEKIARGQRLAALEAGMSTKL